MDRDEQLAWERRLARPAAAAAIGAVALQLAAQIVQGDALSGSGEGSRGFLARLEENSGQVMAGRVLQILSIVLIVAVLAYLFRATRARRDVLPGVVGIMAAAPLLLAVGGVWTQLGLQDVASDFVAGARTETRADQLLEDRNPFPLFLGLAGQIALGFSFVVISLNAMRAGLLSRFMGALGIVVGALTVLPILPGVVVQVFWLGAAAVLLLDRWPGGRGPAWETGTAEPWPSLADQQRARAEAETEPAAGPAPEDEQQPARPAGARKRKRRRNRR